MNSEEDDSERQLREQTAVNKAVNRRLKKVRRAYAQALTQLWFGNAGGAVTVLTFIGAVAKSGTFPRQLLLPLGFFVLGLISMGVGTGLWLSSERKGIRRMEEANSISDWILNSPAPESLRPTESAGLGLKDWRTKAAILAAVLFVFGCAAGLWELVQEN